ncbi:serine/threonine-protein kinase [Rubrivirga marina]|uniref:Protein kinase domain-containing protein n=1 Tax=Rubrivirga marina TaxID=1196024 RepID=A0A271IV61_9BACT|nr:serine/threonine-protein kinase [Rubrivirga marina]PAP74605.1 hypothetical protein BSZ37_20730 [Rubrivirga marina]
MVRRKVGEGGMGAVYLADDPRTGQRAAVKVLTSTAPNARARFAREQRQLAALRHESIPKLLGSGATEDGRPFFAMEYVRGAPITDFARAHSLSPTERLGAFAILCDAVRHAHANLVVHRDIKPSNVVASRGPDGECRVHLLDFGVAKPLDDRDFGTSWGRGGDTTGPGFRPMTPAYAAPEQALPAGAGRAAETTTATDVFALGTLLYELLTGRRPLDGCAPPSRVVELDLSRQGRWAIDAIVERAIDPDPDQRYGSADALHVDVRRVSNGRPPAGVGVSFTRRAAWFAARHRGGLVAASACVLAVVLAFAAAEQRWRASTGGAEASAGQLALVVEDVIRSAPTEARAGRAFLVRAAEIVEGGVSQPTVGADLSLTLAEQLSERGDLDEALRLYSRAVLLRAASGPDHPTVIAALRGQARCAAGFAGREIAGTPTSDGLRRATELAVEARALAVSRYGEGSAVAASIDTDLALYSVYAGELEGALDLSRRASAVFDRLGLDPEAERGGGGLAGVGSTTDAFPLMKSTVGLGLLAARAGTVAALALTAQGKHDEAAERARSATAALRALGRPNGPVETTEAWAEGVALGLHVEALALRRAGARSEALEVTGRAVRVLSNQFGEGDRRSVRARTHDAVLTANRGPQAAAVFSDVVADAEATGDPAILAYALTEQGRTLYQWGSNAAAAVPLRRAVAMRPEDAGPGTAAVARAALAEIALESSDVARALELSEAGLQIARDHLPLFGPYFDALLTAASVHAEALVADGRGNEAVVVLKSAVWGTRSEGGRAYERVERLLGTLEGQ